MSTLKNILFVLSTGYILVYFSEHLFWAQIRTEDSLANWFSTWIAYSLMAYIFLRLVAYFRIKGVGALFLAGAVFGWLAEGVVVQTTYESLPLSISFTGLAWHALLTVWVGWYAIRKVILTLNIWSGIKLASLIGLIYGVWAISWWVEPNGQISSVAEFAKFTFITSTLVIFAYWMTNWSLSTPMKWNRWTTVVITFLFVIYFFFVTVPASPIAIIILPALMGFAYWGLRQNRIFESDGSLLESMHSRVPMQNYIGLIGLPITSTIVYALAMSINLKAQTNWILYLITTPLGFILFIISFYKLIRQARSSLLKKG